MFPRRAAPIHAACLLFLLFGQTSFSSEIILGPWHIRNPAPTGFGRGMVHDGTKYVLVDGYGGIYTSIAGLNWTRQTSPPALHLSSIAYASNKFVAVGSRGTILTSTNATNWTRSPVAFTNDLNKVIHDGQQFIAVGSAGAIITSADGSQFIQLPPSVTNSLWDITAGPGTLVAVGEQSTVLVSTNNNSWRKAVFTTTNQFLAAVAYFDNQYHAGPFTSPDPLLWTDRLFGPIPFVRSLAVSDRHIARLSNLQYQDSTDGRNWSTDSSIPRANFNIVVVSNLFHLVGGGGLYFGNRFTQFTPRHLNLDFQESSGATVYHVSITNLNSTTSGYFAHAYQRTYFAPDGKSWREWTPSDPATIRTISH